MHKLKNDNSNTMFHEFRSQLNISTSFLFENMDLKYNQFLLFLLVIVETSIDYYL